MDRFNLRKKKRINYYEPREPNLDEYIFCSDCKDYVYEYCAIHGPLLVIPDDKVRKLHKTCNNAGIGVFSLLTLPRGVRFGPYRGVDTQDPRPGYCWQIHDGNNKHSHYVDASDANNSNWMRYVNCSRRSSEQNLIAYQYRGMIYYRTIEIIPKFTELLVFYGGEFAHQLDIDIKKYNSPMGYARKLGAFHPLKLPNKEKANKVVKVSKEDAPEKPNLILENKPKESNETILKTSALNKSNKDSNNLNKIPKNSKKLKKYEPPKKIQKDSFLTNSNNSLTEPHVTNNPKIHNRNEKLTLNETKPATNTNLALPTTSKIQINNKLNDKKHDSKFLVPNSKYICNICSYETVNKKSLIVHLRLHDTKEKIHCCSQCQYMTNVKSHFNEHLKKHTGEKPYECDICQRKFSQITHLITHIRTHTGEKPYECHICQRKYIQSTDLKKHIRIHTGEKPYECYICQRKFSNISHLKPHIRTHTGEKPYECHICQRKYSQSTDLKKHIRTHTGEKPYECHICQRKFSNISHLKPHIRTHTGEKPYECHICQRKFTNISHLKPHIRTHTGEKPYECHICQRKCSRSYDLKRHIRIHTGEKPYECNICQRKFSDIATLHKHRRTHSGEKPYECHLCTKKFTQKCTLKQHLRTHTDKEIKKTVA